MTTLPPSDPKALSASALLVIDVQSGLFRKSTRIWQAERVLANINLLIEAARSAGAHVVYVQHASDKVLPYGSDDWRLDPRLTPPEAGDLRVEKQHGNAFEKTDLAAQLAAHGVGQVIVAGLVTHGCVRATSEGALALGYRVILAGDAHSSYSKDAAALVEQWNAQLGQAGAEVQPAAAIAEALGGRA